jgi:hypothetical protein
MLPLGCRRPALGGIDRVRHAHPHENPPPLRLSPPASGGRARCLGTGGRRSRAGPPAQDGGEVSPRPIRPPPLVARAHRVAADARRRPMRASVSHAASVSASPLALPRITAAPLAPLAATPRPCLTAPPLAVSLPAPNQFRSGDPKPQTRNGRWPVDTRATSYAASRRHSLRRDRRREYAPARGSNSPDAGRPLNRRQSSLRCRFLSGMPPGCIRRASPVGADTHRPACKPAHEPSGIPAGSCAGHAACKSPGKAVRHAVGVPPSRRTAGHSGHRSLSPSLAACVPAPWPLAHRPFGCGEGERSGGGHECKRLYSEGRKGT